MPGEKEYSIGFVSKILNMSVEGIRNYEKADIIMARRSDSAYRKFQYLDVTCLMRARIYRALGFSLKEIQEMINGTGIDAFQSGMKRRHQEMLGEQKLIQCKIAYMDEILCAIDEMDTLMDRPRLRMLPGYYRVEFSKNGEITQDEEILRTFAQWMEYMPFVHISSRYHGEDTYGGISIKEEYARLFSIRAGGFIQYLPGGMGIAMYTTEQGGHHTQSRVAQGIRDYAAYHRYEISSDLIGHTVTAIAKKTGYQRYREICTKILTETP